MSAEKKTDFHVVNHSLPRRDGRVKVTGKAQYVADLKLIGKIDWSWWWVTAPLWIPFVFLLVVLAVIGVAALITWLLER